MFEIDFSEKSDVIVNTLYKYMKEKGVGIRSCHVVADSSPYFFLNDNTSISYRKNARKWPKSGIVFFCSADNKIKNILEKDFGLEVFDNSRDEDRPTAVFVPVEMIDNVIEAIK